MSNPNTPPSGTNIPPVNGALGSEVPDVVQNALERTDLISLLDDQSYGAPPAGSGILVNPGFHDPAIFPEGNHQEVAFAVEHNRTWYYSRAGAIQLAKVLNRSLPTLAQCQNRATQKSGLGHIIGIKDNTGVSSISQIYISRASSIWLSPQAGSQNTVSYYYAWTQSVKNKYRAIKLFSNMDKYLTACPVIFSKDTT